MFTDALTSKNEVEILDILDHILHTIVQPQDRGQWRVDFSFSDWPQDHKEEPG